jgi:hypothetical protein
MWMVWLGGTMTALGGLWSWAGRNRSANRTSQPAEAKSEIAANV